MPRLKALTDRLPVTAKSRETAFYTATFGVGAGLYYLWVELTQPFYASPVLFGIAGLCAAMAVVLVSLGVAGGEAAPVLHVAHDR